MNALVDLRVEAALAEAHAGTPGGGPLDGVPISVKHNFDVAGMTAPPLDFDEFLGLGATRELFDRMRGVLWVNLLGLPAVALGNGAQIVAAAVPRSSGAASGRRVPRRGAVSKEESMTDPVRPASGLFADPRPVRALADLFANIWQVAYVTTDLDRGIEVMRERFGVEHCSEVPTAGATFLRGDEPAEWEARIAMGARGGLIVELIEPVAGEVDFYRRYLPRDGSPALRFHHLATFMPLGDEAWGSLIELLAASGLKVDYTVLIPYRVRAGYVDTTAELGHFLEVCQLQEADTALFTDLVAKSA